MGPVVFEPYLRPMVWGGRRLETVLGKPLPTAGPYGESWELSAHPLHVSRVAAGNGVAPGTALADLWQAEGPKWVGDRAGPGSRFPWLIKYLDCDTLLSVQVHPSDELARKLHVDESGKTEAWVVLEAAPTARVYAGLQAGVTPRDFERHLAAGTVAECLHPAQPQPGDVWYLPAGVVHAVGGGVLLAEVQQTSDATFRLFDWNRVGDDGRPRPLHIAEALQAIDWSQGPLAPRPPRPLPTPHVGLVRELLVQCPYFQIERYRWTRQPCAWPPGELAVGMVLSGTAELVLATGVRRRFGRGTTCLLPPQAAALSWEPVGSEPVTLLRVTLPASGGGD